MQLDERQRETLKSLTEHPWFAILEEMERDERIALTDKFLEADVSNPDTASMLREHQIYCKARRDFLELAKGSCQEIYSPV